MGANRGNRRIPPVIDLGTKWSVSGLTTKTALPRGKKIPVLIEQTSGQTPEFGSKFWGREKSLPPLRGFLFMQPFGA